MSPLILRNRDFALLWGSQCLSQAGTRMFQIALAWWALGHYTENSGLVMAVILITGVLPSMLLYKWIGNAAETRPPRSLLTWVDSLGTLVALCMAALFATGSAELWWILPLLAILATLQGLIEPTLQKNVKGIVEGQDLGAALGFLGVTQTLASFLGAVVGAFFIEQFGIVVISLLNALSFFVSLWCDRSIRFGRVKAEVSLGEDAEEQLGKSKKSILPELKRYAPTLSLLVGFAIVNLFGTPILLVIPLYVKEILQGTGNSLAIAEACVWLGLISGSLGSGWIGLKDNIIALFCTLLLVYGVFLMIPSLGIGLPLYGLCLFICGFCVGTINLRIITWFHTILPDQIKGRFFALLQALTGAMVPVGFFGFGLLADFTDVLNLPFLQGLGVILAAAFFAVLGWRRRGLVHGG